MTTPEPLTILQRVYALADRPPSQDACRAVATIARKIATDDDAATKAHAINGVLKGFDAGAQAKILAAVEALYY